MNTVYVIGSLRNPRITEVGNALRAAGYDAFDEWHAGGPEADDEWRRYEQDRGRHYKEALRGYHARNIFEFDLYHLNRSDAGVLVMPAGRSGHLELGYLIGQGKLGFILFDEVPERLDIMHSFATAVCFSLKELMDELEAVQRGDARVAEQRKQARFTPWNA